MPTNINIPSIFPTINRQVNNVDSKNISDTTFIGIDFGTSTTVVSMAIIDTDTKEIKTTPIWLNQILTDGTIASSEKIPTVIAWYNDQLLIGKGAAELKHILKKGINVWFSFKMELGEDLGPKYYNSELNRNSDTPILNAKDATRVFFMYLKSQIDRYIRNNNLPANLKFAVSIPASFEANQRKELIEALEYNGIQLNKQSLIDEPNAAFLSYIQDATKDEKPLILPEGANPKVLIFDFGAGTCDISILELGKDLNGIYTKNLSISKFEKLGGDDIDRLIATDYLFPKMLSESNKEIKEFTTSERNRIISRLLIPAEQLKIIICQNIDLKTADNVLPTAAVSTDFISLGYSIEIDTTEGMLHLKVPNLSFSEFNDIMNVFLFNSPLELLGKKIKSNSANTIFNPIKSALNKANLSNTDIDYVLFIGGSCKNPYVRSAIKGYFDSSKILLPKDLQTHVSSGAAIHSLIFNGFDKNIIQPITSEPFLIITQDERSKVILPAGIHIPCEKIVIDDLVTNRDGQEAIEIPICLGTPSKILYNIKIVSNSPLGFKKNVPVKLEVAINSDKLLLARAFTEGQEIIVNPINPFVNSELSTEQRITLQAERQANIEADLNNGTPTKSSLENLRRAYEKVGSVLKAAETLELLNELYPSVSNYNQIGVLYSSAGYDQKALKYYELAYTKNKSSTTAFNYAHQLKSIDKNKFKEILEESLALDPEKPHTLYELGSYLKNANEPKGLEMMNKAFNIWKKQFEANQLSETNYSWLSSVSRELGMSEFAQHVLESKPQKSLNEMYNHQNLTVTFTEQGLTKK